jgi:hypothetical protein
MQEDRTRRPIAALFLSAKVQLIIKDVSITRKIPMAIRSAAGSLGIRKEYLQERNNWSEATLDDVHWDAHCASHSYHCSHRCYLVKLCHRHLPLGHTLHRRDNKYPSTCPGCRLEPKTQSHYIQCKAPSRMLWRIKIRSKLQTQMEKLHTDTNLQETIIHCLDSAIADRAIPLQGPFREAIQAQARISWLGMLWGHWKTKW